MVKDEVKEKTGNRYHLQSNEMVGAPNIVAWAKNGYAFESDREKLLNVITEGWPGVTREAARKLLSGEVPYTVDDKGTVTFEVPDNPCDVCGEEIGFDAPSGVCSEECLRKGQEGKS